MQHLWSGAAGSSGRRIVAARGRIDDAGVLVEGREAGATAAASMVKAGAAMATPNRLHGPVDRGQQRGAEGVPGDLVARRRTVNASTVWAASSRAPLKRRSSLGGPYGAPAAGSLSSRSISSAACRSCAAWKCA